MKPPAFSTRSAFRWFTGLCLGLAVAAWCLWLLSAAQYRRIIDQWIADGQARGVAISYDSRASFGFPRRVIVRLTGFRVRTGDGLLFQTGALDIAAVPWRWDRFEARFKDHTELTAPLDREGHALTLASDEGTFAVKLDSGDRWRRLDLALHAARIGVAPRFLFGATRLDVAAFRPQVTPTDEKTAGLTVSLDAVDIAIPPALPTPFGSNAETLGLQMRVMGPVPDLRRRAEVAAWNDGSGVVQFDRFRVRWGDLDAALTGTLGFDDDLQPEGAFSGTVAAPQKLFTDLVGAGLVPMHDRDMLDMITARLDKLTAKHNASHSAIAAAQAAPALPVTRAGIPDDVPDGLPLPLTVQLGSLFLGPVKVFSFPPVVWPTAPPELSAP